MQIQPQEFLMGADAESVKCDLFAQAISHCGKARLKVWGTSMVPAILPGDTLIVEGQPMSGLAVGDVAVYLRLGRLFAHRVVKVESKPEPALITRGDAMECDDPPVLAHEIVGRVASIAPRPRLTRRIRRGLSALTKRLGSSLLIAKLTGSA